jgi:hypothetical protein
MTTPCAPPPTTSTSDTLSRSDDNQPVDGSISSATNSFSSRVSVAVIAGAPSVSPAGWMR